MNGEQLLSSMTVNRRPRGLRGVRKVADMLAYHSAVERGLTREETMMELNEFTLSRYYNLAQRVGVSPNKLPLDIFVGIVIMLVDGVDVDRIADGLIVAKSCVLKIRQTIIELVGNDDATATAGDSTDDEAA